MCLLKIEIHRIGLWSVSWRQENVWHSQGYSTQNDFSSTTASGSGFSSDTVTYKPDFNVWAFHSGFKHYISGSLIYSWMEAFNSHLVRIYNSEASTRPHITLSCWWCNKKGYYFILSQSNPSSIDLEWVQVEKKHPFESDFKNYIWKSHH